MNTPSSPSNLERIGIVIPPPLIALIVSFQAVRIQSVVHDIFMLGVLGITGYLFFEASRTEKQRRGLVLLAFALAGGAALLS